MKKNTLPKSTTQQITQITNKVIFEGSQKELGSRHRSYFVRTYLPMDKLLELFQYAEHYAVIEHDKDQGTVHRHFIVTYRYNTTPTAFGKKLDDPDEQSYIRVLHDKYSAFDYLLHRDEKSVASGKYRYDEKQVLTDDYSYWQRSALQEQKQANDEQFLIDLLDSRLTFREMAKRYGRDYMKNHKAYEEFARLVAVQESLNGNAPDIETDEEIVGYDRFYTMTHTFDYEPYKPTEPRLKDDEKAVTRW